MLTELNMIAVPGTQAPVLGGKSDVQSGHASMWKYMETLD